MGCDIHLYREKNVNGAWLAADVWVEDAYEPDRKEVPYGTRAYDDRNYELFGLLAKGVRSEHPFSLAPRGMPFDPSPEVARARTDWDSDGHTHSYLYLHELKALAMFLNTVTIHIDGMKDAAQLAALTESIASGEPDWNLLFPYSAWSNIPGHVKFEMDVPASMYMGGGLRKIIDAFDGIDGDNHRIVFWFDN